MTANKKFTKTEIIFIVFVLAVGAFLRFYKLGVTPGWWPDEGVMLNIAQNAIRGKMQMLSFTYPFVPHPPLYFYLAGIWTSVFSASITALRAMSGLIGLVSIFLTYLIARELGPKISAMVAAIVLACFPAVLIDERIGLSYPLLAMLFLASTYQFIKFVRTKHTRHLLFSALFAGLCPITSYIGMIAPITILIGTAINVKYTKSDAFWTTILSFAPFIAYIFVVGSISPSAVLHDLRYMLNARPENAKPLIENIASGFRSLSITNGILLLGLVGIFFSKYKSKYFLFAITLLAMLAEFKTRGYWWYMQTYLPLLVVGVGLLFGFIYTTLTKLKIKDTIATTLTIAALFLVFGKSFEKSFVTIYKGNYFGLAEEELFSPKDPSKLTAAINFININSRPTDVVMSSAHLTWMIKAKPSDPIQAYVYSGHETTNFPADMYSTDRFVYDVSLSNTKFFLEDNFVRNWFIFQPGIKDGITDPIYKSWNKIFDNGEFRVYENQAK